VHMIVWSFRPRTGCRPQFEEAYGPQGTWARLFGTSPEFLGSTLLRNVEDSGLFVTIDRWRSAAAYDTFVAERRNEYEPVDRLCECLTEAEVLVGRFDEML
jgi:heme-degrading monooxygenase HmoA